MSGWIKTIDGQYVNPIDVSRTYVTYLFDGSDEWFHYVIIVALRNGDEVAYRRSERLRDSDNPDYSGWDEQFNAAERIKIEATLEALMEEHLG